MLSCQTNANDSSISNHSVTSEMQQTKLPIVGFLKENEHLPIEERIGLYRELKKSSPQLYDFSNEDELTMYGYQKLWTQQIDEAIAIFILITEEFPNSSNAFDSLGEGYLVKGNTELALKNYQISLSMNPDNFNAEDQIEKILFPSKTYPTPTEKFVTKFAASDYLEDLDQLSQNLIKINPSALKFTTKKDFLALVEAEKLKVNDQMEYGQFLWLCYKIIAAVNCSHTYLDDFWENSRLIPEKVKFPLNTHWLNDRLYIIDPLSNSDKLKIKTEITSINGIPVPDLIKEIYLHIPSQGHIETTKAHVFNQYARTLITFALDFPSQYTITTNEQTTPISLKNSTSISPDKNYSLKRSCPDDLCLSFEENDEIAIITLSSFNYYPWNNLKVFEQFIDSCFQTITQNKTEHLIIDLRGNGGGSRESSIYLLSYLFAEPFTYYSNITDWPETPDQKIQPFSNRYKGKSYFIIDGVGNSTTGHFMSLVKKHHLGTIFGEELGSNQYCTAGQTVCRLKKTRTPFYVSNTIVISSATNLPDDRGILPDVFINQDIESYLQRNDLVKDQVIQHITEY